MTARLNHTIVAARDRDRSAVFLAEMLDAIFARIVERGLAYWPDPFRRERGKINHWDDGRGVYFDDPNGHLLEITTKPYGSAGTEVHRPHPLIASKIETPEAANRAGNGGSRDPGKQGGGALAGAERPR